MAANKTIEVSNTSDFRKGLKKEISAYAYWNGDSRYWFRTKHN